MSSAGSGQVRLHAVDHIKAAAIVAVVVTHAGQGSWDPDANRLDFILTTLWTRFHVPSFLFVSGLLYARHRGVDLAHVGARLGRVLLPYLLASAIAQLAGVTTARGLQDIAFQLATGSSLGIYYYIFVFTLCIPAIWPLSRLPRGAVAAACLGCLGLTAVFVVHPSLRLATSVFWSLRDPLQFFSLGFFLAGWWVALSLPALARFRERNPRLSLGLPLLVASTGLALMGRWLPVSFGMLDRVLYTFGVIGLIAAASSRRPAGAAVRFLGDATLAIYLYHRIFQLLAQPLTQDLPDLARIATQVVVGLGGASALVWAGRRLLGVPRARQLLGA